VNRESRIEVIKNNAKISADKKQRRSAGKKKQRTARGRFLALRDSPKIGKTESGCQR
jgi:hypothetical protein